MNKRKLILRVKTAQEWKAVIVITRIIDYIQHSDRSVFIARVYNHVFGVIVIVVILEFLLFRARIAQPISEKMLQASWLLILAGLHVLGWLARRITYRTRSIIARYAGLGIYTVAKTAIIMPLLYLADCQIPGVIQQRLYLRLLGLGTYQGGF